jgi:hypothetical protein
VEGKATTKEVVAGVEEEKETTTEAGEAGEAGEVEGKATTKEVVAEEAVEAEEMATTQLEAEGLDEADEAEVDQDMVEILVMLEAKQATVAKKDFL